MDKQNYSAVDPQKLKEQKHKTKRKGEIEKDDLFNVLQTIPGRRVLWRVLEHCKVFSTIWSDQPTRLGYNSGQQDIGHYLLEIIMNADPEAYVKMLKDKQEGNI